MHHFLPRQKWHALYVSSHVLHNGVCCPGAHSSWGIRISAWQWSQNRPVTCPQSTHGRFSISVVPSARISSLAIAFMLIGVPFGDFDMLSLASVVRAKQRTNVCRLALSLLYKASVVRARQRDNRSQYIVCCFFEDKVAQSSEPYGLWCFLAPAVVHFCFFIALRSPLGRRLSCGTTNQLTDYSRVRLITFVRFVGSGSVASHSKHYTYTYFF